MGRSVRAAAAMLMVNADLARILVNIAPEGRVAVVGQTAGPRTLPVRGLELKEYAAAVDVAPLDALPAVYEAGCETIPSLLAGGAGRVFVVSYPFGCGRLAGAAATLRQSFTYQDWLTLGRRAGVVTAVLVPVAVSR